VIISGFERSDVGLASGAGSSEIGTAPRKTFAAKLRNQNIGGHSEQRRGLGTPLVGSEIYTKTVQHGVQQTVLKIAKRQTYANIFNGRSTSPAPTKRFSAPALVAPKPF
jgi:hypothetical protein